MAGRRGIVPDARGAALVEFTLVLPLLVILTIGTMELGRALQHHHVINKGVRDAARYLARVPITCPSGGGFGTPVTPADETRAKNLAISGYADGGSPLLDYWTQASSITITYSCEPKGNLRGLAREVGGVSKTLIAVIGVTANVTYGDLGFLSILNLGPITFTVSHEEMHIGE